MVQLQIAADYAEDHGRLTLAYLLRNSNLLLTADENFKYGSGDGDGYDNGYGDDSGYGDGDGSGYGNGY